MKNFSYHGRLSTSKSLMNRALVVQSYFPELEILGASHCADVQHMQKALAALARRERYFSVGDGGTTLRFLAGRVSRLPGEWHFKGSDRLMARPHEGLWAALAKLGCDVSLRGLQLTIVSRGWKIPDYLKVDTSQSSQFVSSLLLNSWNLEKELVINMVGDRPSLAYLQMTIELLQELGMEIEYREPTIRVAAGQRLLRQQISLEPDMSSTFALASFAALGGHLMVEEFPITSRQPDFCFIQLFKDLGVPLVVDQRGLQVSAGQSLKAIEFDLLNSPDMFPVLAVLLTAADGTSTLRGLATLAYKESHRLAKTGELLTKMGITFVVGDDEFKIFGTPNPPSAPSCDFDPDSDHRMVMAAQLAKHLGYKIRITNPQVVNKSFPEFFSIVGEV